MQSGAVDTGKMEFKYESDASASFLVIQCDAVLVEYQVKMLENNRMKGVIPPEIVRKEGRTCFYYNITSKVSLSFFLNRRKFCREEFLQFLLRITTDVNGSAGYLLTDTNFLFSPDTIYIDPETLEPALIYLPAALDENDGFGLQCFIADLVLQHINVAGFDLGNLVQQILAMVKSDLFHIKGLIRLLNELLYRQEADGCPEKAENGSADGKPQGGRSVLNKVEKRDKKSNTLQILESSSAVEFSDPIQNRREGKAITQKTIENPAEANKPTRGRQSAGLVVLALALQVVMAGIIYFTRGFLNKVGNNPTATYAAVALIVLAVEVLLFKKMMSAGLIRLGSGQENKLPEGYKGKHPNIPDEKQKMKTGVEMYGKPAEKVKIKPEVKPKQLEALPAISGWNDSCTDDEREIGSGSVRSGTAERISYKTELLGGCGKTVRLLKSTGKQGEDITINKDDFIIGRLEGSVDHMLDNKAVGKLHVQLVYKEGACYVKDLNSMNGTYINGLRIESNKEFKLEENDRLRLANSEFIYMYV